MTKKDYQLIATAIQASRNKRSPIGESAIDVVVVKLANALKTDNVRFDFNRFIQACEAKP